MPAGAAPNASDIKAEAFRLGFSHVGIATAERFVEAEQHTLEWLRQGRQGEMTWITRERVERACSPETLLPGARSIVAVAAPYGRGGESPPSARLGRVARYARGDDYHDLMKRRLHQLSATVAGQAGGAARCRVFVDDGPLLDRAAAARAGIGFVGKNTCLIAPGAGSYLLLGAVLTDLKLPPDPPLVRDCGNCRACLDACPTGALLEPFELDARRCIAYLTIELRGEIPDPLRQAIGSRIFGCDICQEVCPYNAGRGPLPWPEFAPRAEVGPDLDLVELLQLDTDTFRNRFKGTSLKRTGRRGLVRNAAVALGCAAEAAAVPPLERAAADDPDPIVREHAEWALRRLGRQSSDHSGDLQPCSDKAAWTPETTALSGATDRPHLGPD